MLLGRAIGRPRLLITAFRFSFFFEFLVNKPLDKELDLDRDPHWDLGLDPQLENMLDPDLH